MSVTGTRLPLLKAQEMADAILSQIDGEAHIVGSVRRLKPDVGDIDILVHKDAKINFEISPGPMFPGTWQTIKGGPKDKEDNSWVDWNLLHVESGVYVDLYRFDEHNRGSKMLIRTGPEEFSKRFVIALKPKGLIHSEGYIREKEEGLLCSSPFETDAFAYAGLQYIEPENRK